MAIRGKPANPDMDPKTQKELDEAAKEGRKQVPEETRQPRGHTHYADRDGRREPSGRTTGHQQPGHNGR